PSSSALECCPGWKQQGDECTIAVCEGNFTCKDNEVCVRPNECRCRHGYFGPNCETKCPDQFWGPDCKKMCTCFPNGRCNEITGKCTCNANRWGPNCENVCRCQHGTCDQDTGKCTCEPKWWGPLCSSSCYCSPNSQCDQSTGRCICHQGWWGHDCFRQCSCNNSPCEQFTGRCQCRERLWGSRCERYCQCFKGKCNQVDGTCTCNPGYRGKFCREPCPAGLYGQGCRRRCGRCKGQQPCTIAEGRCLACEAGWNGTKCDQICSSGTYGDGCEKSCPPCKDGHTCNHIDGKCSHCNAGWIGDRCDVKCPNGTYGENCDSICSDCFNGECHFATGDCLCNAGSFGPFCNMTCPEGRYGVNCAETCYCHEDTCNPITGACYMQANQRMGVMAAGVLVALLLILLLSLLCCCCICSKKDCADHANSSNKKKPHRRFCGRFSRISMKLPRIPLRRQKLPKVVVAHHDMENTFNCSFLEPPSVVEQPSPSWSSRGSFSSFDTTDEGPVYCVPHEGALSESQVREISFQPLGTNTLALFPACFLTSQTDNTEAPLLKSSDSEGSTSGSESTGGALYARIARLSKQSKDDDEPMMDSKHIIGKPPSPERIKPPPPDPSTKPKVSWIHGKFNTSQSSSLPASSQGMAAKEHNRKRTSSETSGGHHSKNEVVIRHKDRGHKSSKESSSVEEPQTPTKTKAHRSKTSPEQIENINGAVQNALKAATLLAAQLKEKTQSLNRGDGGTKPNGIVSPHSHREKPTPPQKAKRSVGGANQKSSKPVLPTTNSLQKMISPISESGPRPKKTPIKKPPRKKGKDATLDLNSKSQPKMA
uniref:Scavenger receptor class F member 2 n=1 Tax=Latimeria chalumnae TaxID=7897 RepID=H3A2V7_LATCH